MQCVSERIRQGAQCKRPAGDIHRKSLLTQVSADLLRIVMPIPVERAHGHGGQENEVA